MFKKFTNEQRPAIIEAICEEISNESFCEVMHEYSINERMAAFIPIAKICKNHGISFGTLHRWCARNITWEKMLNDAKKARASAYKIIAFTLMDETIEMISALDNNASSALFRKTVKKTNKKAHNSERFLQLAYTLNPDLGVPSKYDIWRLRKKLEKLRKLVDMKYSKTRF